MLSPKYFTLAAGKTADTDEREALARLEGMAAELATIEREFPGVLAARKAQRGAPAVKLSKGQRAFVDGVDADLAASEQEQLVLLEHVSSALEVVEVLAMTVPGAPTDWSVLLPGTDDEDKPLVEEVVRRQRALRAGMQAYLDRFGHSGAP